MLDNFDHYYAAPAEPDRRPLRCAAITFAACLFLMLVIFGLAVIGAVWS